ncbi:MAG: hypothetical protein JFR24_08350 [Muribaculaceae bacterium]|nr:hypothetical protein [Muribaculaceae bacterium]
MKRLISILLATMCMTVCCLAAGSGLACEQFFGDEYRILKNVDITIVNDNNNHYHSISVKGDRALVKKIRKAVETDRKKAYNSVENYRNGQCSLVLNILLGNKLWNIGFEEKGGGHSCTMYLQTNGTKRNSSVVKSKKNGKSKSYSTSTSTSDGTTTTIITIE